VHAISMSLVSARRARASLFSSPSLPLSLSFSLSRFFSSENFSASVRVLFPAASASESVRRRVYFRPVEDERVTENSNPATPPFSTRSKTLLITAQSGDRFSRISLHCSLPAPLLSHPIRALMKIATVIFITSRRISFNRDTRKKSSIELSYTFIYFLCRKLFSVDDE